MLLVVELVSYASEQLFVFFTEISRQQRILIFNLVVLLCNLLFEVFELCLIVFKFVKPLAWLEKYVLSVCDRRPSTHARVVGCIGC